MSSDCIFCMIGVESIKSEILYNNDTCFVIRDIDPKAPIHLLVIPYKHFEDLTNFTSDFYETICGIFEAIKKGATAIVANGRAPITNKVPIIQVSNPRKVMSKIAANFFKHPSQEIKIIGLEQMKCKE